jgi:hypothetical protein
MHFNTQFSFASKWEDNIKMKLKETKLECVGLDPDSRQKLVAAPTNMIINLQVSQKTENILSMISSSRGGMKMAAIFWVVERCKPE